MSSAQPAPTLTSLTLRGQRRSALVYSSPGRQTLSVTGLNIVALRNATGPAIDAGAPVSLYDAVIDGGSIDGGEANGASGAPRPNRTAILATANLFARNVYVRGFDELVGAAVRPALLPPSPPASAADSGWSRIAWFADGVGNTLYGSSVI